MTTDDGIHYAGGDPEALRGVPQRRTRRGPLTRHVPVRFPAETIDRVLALADAEGITVSSWIRRAVEEDMRRRTFSAATVVTVAGSVFTESAATTSTEGTASGTRRFEYEPLIA
jgi:hypothetical protein